jgi:multidrug efflux pump subunit AcrA (membrane-fusion protein)
VPRSPSTIPILNVTGALFLLNACVSAGFAAEQTVRLLAVDDRKAVIATVEPVRQLVARARIEGTITSLTVKEGSWVNANEHIAVVADQKLLLQMQALQSRIQAQQANRDQAQINFDRVQKLRAANVSSQAQVDQAKTSLDVAQRTLQALLSDRQVIEEQVSQGAVLAPGTGRVLKVPVSEGTVVMPGETIATIAINNYILRLQLPERHAQFMKTGDTILIGARGLQVQQQDATTRSCRSGLSSDRTRPGRRGCRGREPWRLLRRRAYPCLHRHRNARGARRPRRRCLSKVRGELCKTEGWYGSRCASRSAR